MLKILIWVVSNDGRFFNSALNILGRQHNGIEVVGVTAGEKVSVQLDGKNVPYIPLARLTGGVYDVLLIVGARQIGMSKISQEAQKFNLPEEKLLGDWIVCIPGFTLEKYRRLQESRLSILTMNCFGGLISHTLGLPFRSPFANLRMERPDFLTFLHDPRTYMEKKLIFKEKFFHQTFKHYYPIYSLGDIAVRMVHYPNFAEAVLKWEERKKKINWYNLMIITISNSLEMLEEFDSLPYGKKICFVPFKSDLDSAWYINPNHFKTLKFWEIVHNYARGNVFFYDMFDMLLYGKKTPL